MLAVVLAACTGRGGPGPEARSPGERSVPSAPALSGQHDCVNAPGFRCATLTVPLDQSGRAPGTLALQVAVQQPPAGGSAPRGRVFGGDTGGGAPRGRVFGGDTGGGAPRGFLVLLTGGPGQPGVPYAQRLARKLGAASSGFRLVMFDQRGTGAGALDCPLLQQEMGSSDLRTPTRDAVTQCAARIGPQRRFYGTADTIADIDMLRRALGARRLTLDGVSYGSYVAERYALAYPDRVSRLVLDSVVPQNGGDPFEIANMRATARVLRAACLEHAPPGESGAVGGPGVPPGEHGVPPDHALAGGSGGIVPPGHALAGGSGGVVPPGQHCPYDPATDLAVAARAPYGGVALLDALVTLSVINPSFTGIPAALHAARTGNPAALESIIGRLRSGDRTPASELSQGLHASALCADTPFPWRASTPLERRADLLARALAGLRPGEASPFTLASAEANGIVQTCLHWPPEPAEPPAPRRNLPPVPVLLLAGDRDLSTPLEWARQEAAMAPVHRLMVVPGDGHSVQSRGMTRGVMRVLERFLHG
jgi:pimeloyl-ACP methyl ester carboxylesterase